MTDDIVARLRKIKEEGASSKGDVIVGIKIEDVCEAYSEISLLRAALRISQNLDEPLRLEIERLRAALREIAGHKISGIIPDDYNVRSWTLHNYVEIREIARAALAGEKADD